MADTRTARALDHQRRPTLDAEETRRDREEAPPALSARPAPPTTPRRHGSHRHWSTPQNRGARRHAAANAAGPRGAGRTPAADRDGTADPRTARGTSGRAHH
ncbi:hypothetical protein AB0Q97_20350, partial [Streptomyces sp. NPDC088135]